MSSAALKKTSHENANCATCNVAGITHLCKESETTIQLIEDAKNSFVLKPGDQLEIVNEKRRSLFLVRSGVIKLFSSIDESSSLELLYKGAFFGGFDYLSSDEFKVTAEAGCETQICELKEDVLQKLFSANSQFLKRYLFFLGLYISNLKKDKIETRTQNIVRLLAKALQRDFKERGYQYKGHLTVTKFLSQNEWAILLGCRRESVTRAFSELESAKAIEVKSGSLSLLSETALVSFLIKK